LALVHAEVVLVDLFVLELVNISPDDYTDVEIDEKADDIADEETDLSARAEYRTARNLVEVLVVALDQAALGEHEVGREDGQGEGEQEADPDENRVGLDHAAVSNHRANESEKRDGGDDSENNTGDDETNSGTRGDFDLGVVQEVWSSIDGMDKPEKRSGGETAAKEG